MIADQPMRTILEKNGLDSCSLFVRDRINEIDLSRFVELLCSPHYTIYIPLACIFHQNILIADNEISRTEMDQLVKVIERFQALKQMSEYELGRVLDHVLKCHLNNQVISSVADLSRIFALLQSPNSAWILDLLVGSSRTNFWYELFNRWVQNYGVGRITALTRDLLKSADIQPLQDILSRSDTQKVRDFFEDLELIQVSDQFLSSTDWQRIIERRAGEDGNALAVLHSAVLGKCFLNWMAVIEPAAHDSDLSVEIASVVMALVQDKNWRFRDVQKLFRFSKKKKDLPGLLGALMQIQEGNLKSAALDRLPKSVSLQDIDVMLENDREFQPPTEISRTDAIQIIANSDFNQFTHPEANITEYNLTQMMSEFDNCYNGSDGGHFSNEARSIKAVEKFFKVKMRDVQIMGILLAIKARRASVSRLLQMQTGEGKTYVIAALAIAEVLNGNNVDIITSSEMLAVTQTEELKKLYASVGITVQTNCTDDRKEKEISKVYKANVIYGTAASFMSDVLYEEFWGSKLRYGRGFPVAIVDEVDAQMLDHANQVCRFASSTSGMGNLLGIQAMVWMLVSRNYHDMEFSDGVWKVDTGDGTKAEIADVGTLKKYFKDGLTNALEKTAGFQEGAKEKELVHFPKTLEKFCKRELPLWIESAIEANLKQLDFEYCIENDQIVIVDSARSGTRNRGMTWNNGLHQFLEMRHATKLKPENLTMCFLSTMSFFRRYKTNVIGLTGTIGGNASRKFLHDVYNVDFVEIPPFMVWRHLILPHILCDNTDQWLQTITDKAATKLREGRACLVITQYIHFAGIIAKRIRAENTGGRVFTYTGAGGHSEGISGKIAPRTCIVATNVAGRGTDFKISGAVEQAGGLHVMLTSLPENDRVERQNIGRSSRSGQPGTSQMILNVEQVDGYFLVEMVRRSGDGASHTALVNSLREVRDDWAMLCVGNRISEMRTIQQSDAALTEFISLRNNLVERYKDYKKPAKEKDKSYMQMQMESALNFRFGVYLATNHSALEPEKIREDFGDLPGIWKKDDIPKCFSDYSYPVYAAWILEWNLNKNPDEFYLAQRLLSRAVDLDPKFAGAAYYIRAFSFLICYAHFKDTDYIWKAVEDLKSSRSVIQLLLDQYQLLMVATKEKDEDKTKLGAQVGRLMVICGLIMSNIDILIGRDVDEELEKLKLMVGDMSGKDVAEMEKQIKELEENRETLKKGVLKEIADEGAELEVKEHRLKDILPKDIKPDDFEDEIDHFENEGYFRLITVNKREKVNWWSVLAVTFLGILQIVGGALLAVFTGGIGADIGVGLMMAGCFDIFTAIKSGIIDRNFSWKAYALDKLVDLVTIAISAGLAGMKIAINGISRGVKTMAKLGTNLVAKEALKLLAKHAAKAALQVGAKIVFNEVFNATVAGPMKQAVADSMTDGIKEVIALKILNNPNLKHIVDVDNHHNNQRFSSEFVDQATKHFLRQFSPDFLERLVNSVGDGLKNNQAIGKVVKTAINVKSVGIVIGKITEHIDKLPEILVEIARHADSGGNKRHDNRVYEKKGELSVDSVIRSLASNISDFCATKIVSNTVNFFSSNISNRIVNKAFKTSDKQLQHFQNAFVTSENVAHRARSAIGKGGIEDDAVLTTIAEVAENPNKPGDRLQAKYLAEVSEFITNWRVAVNYPQKVVQAPIEIEFKDINGDSHLIVYGREFSKNVPIRLKFEEGKHGQPGHYSFADGSNANPSGEKTCLFDTVAEVTKYESHELKRAAANFMLNDLELVKYFYSRSSYADLLVGGLRNRGVPKSSSAEKHVEYVETVNDVLRKANSTQAARKFPVRTNTIVDHDLEKFDDKADASFDSWLASNPNAEPTGRRRNVQYDYIHDESNIYEVEYGGEKRKDPIGIEAYRGNPAFKVEHLDGAVHYDSALSTQNTPKLNIWKQGDPTNVRLQDVFKDHPDHGT